MITVTRQGRGPALFRPAPTASDRARDPRVSFALALTAILLVVGVTLPALL